MRFFTAAFPKRRLAVRLLEGRFRWGEIVIGLLDRRFLRGKLVVWFLACEFRWGDLAMRLGRGSVCTHGDLFIDVLGLRRDPQALIGVHAGLRSPARQKPL